MTVGALMLVLHKHILDTIQSDLEADSARCESEAGRATRSKLQEERPLHIIGLGLLRRLSHYSTSG